MSCAFDKAIRRESNCSRASAVSWVLRSERKNSLFAGSEGGAESWAILGSLVTTAKLNSLDPQTYLTDVLERIVSGRTKNHQLHELLAWNWKAAREPAERTAA